MSKITKITLIIFLAATGFLVFGNDSFAACQLSGARWSKTSATVNETVQLIVEGSGCQGESVSLEILEKDDLRDDLITNLNSAFDSSGQNSVVQWRVDGSNDDDNAASDINYRFYFIARGAGFQKKSNTLFVPIPKPSETCQLTGANWDKQVASVGEPVTLVVNGAGCNAMDVSLNVYEDDFGPYQFILKIGGKFTSGSTNNNAAAIYTFTAADYAKGGNESGEEEIYFEAVVIIPTTTQEVKIRSDTLTLKEPVSGACQLSTASWRWNFSDQPILGSPVEMIVNGAGCPSSRIKVEIKEQNVGLGDDLIHTTFSDFNSQGTRAVVPWTVNKGNDDDNIGSYAFYFIASLVNNPSAKVQSGILNGPSGIPLNSETGCINCNALVQPGTCQCADGFSQERGFGQDCRNICQEHIGDAQGGDDKPEAQPCLDPEGEAIPCPSGGDQVVSISLPNPIQAESLVDLAKAIGRFLLQIAIPIAVIVIIYAGILFLTSRGKPEQINKAKTVLLYAVIGLAVILIGQGFFTLIKSILDLGGPTPEF